MSATASIEAAFALHQAGNLTEAERLYRAQLEVEPDNLNCLQLLGLLAGSTGRTTEAVTLLERAVAALGQTGKESAQHAALYNNLGNALKVAGRTADAIEAYRCGLRLDPRTEALHANLAAALLLQKDFEEACESCRAALRLNPENVESWCCLAAACAEVRRHEEAIAASQRALMLRPNHGPALISLGEALASLGRLDHAIAALQTAATADPTSRASRFSLARVCVMAGRHEMAAELFSRLAAEVPDEPSVHLGLAQVYSALRRPEMALQSAARLLALRPDDAVAHYSMARICHSQGDLSGAEPHYRSALRLQPDLIDALVNLGVLLVDTKRPGEAVELSRLALLIKPGNADANCVLGSALLAMHDLGAAVDAFVQCLRAKPDSVAALYRLGIALDQQGLRVQAAECLRRAIALQPDHASAHGELGNILQSLGENAAAREAFLRAQQLRPITSLRGTKEKPDFSILVVTAPGVGNTPCRYLVGNDAYDSHFLGLLPELTLDVDTLRAKCDVLVNLISDPDQGQEILAAAAMLVDRLDRPIVNHPRRILATGRETVAATLVGIPSCRVPGTRRCSAEGLAAPDAAAWLAPFAFPLLLRQAGTHGGDAFEKIEEPGGIASFLGQYPSSEYYVTEWADYRSSDGYFRKYRLIFTDGQIFPYHLAIHDDWKVHHYRTDMDANPWMQHEEEAFLKDPTKVFGEPHYAALRVIQRRIGLEFFGIDCALDRDGELVVFEVNASMLVHDDNADFPYKASYVARIKQAFDAMLARMAATQWQAADGAAVA